jgi:hypothetical protein
MCREEDEKKCAFLLSQKIVARMCFFESPFEMSVQ